jgi:hypothetical protein
MTPYSQLNLSAEQTAKIHAIRETEMRETKPLRDQMFIKGGDLKLLWLEKSPNKDKILAVQKELRAIREQLDEKKTIKRLAILDVLTPEQKTKLQSFRGGEWAPGTAWVLKRGPARAVRGWAAPGDDNLISSPAGALPSGPAEPPPPREGVFFAP